MFFLLFVACVFGTILKDVPRKITKTEPTYKKKTPPQEFSGPETAEKTVSPEKKSPRKKKVSLGGWGGTPIADAHKTTKISGTKSLHWGLLSGGRLEGARGLLG